MNPALVAVIVDELPSAVALLKAAFQKRHPDDQVPTSEEVLTTYRQVVDTTLAKDAAILAEHDGQSER